MTSTNIYSQIYGTECIKENFLNSRYFGSLLHFSKPFVKPYLLKDTHVFTPSFTAVVNSGESV